VAEFEFYLEALQTEVEATLVAEGITVPHAFGLRELKALTSPPRYVWVPSRSAERKQGPHRAVTEYRTLFANAEHAVVHCWGRTYAEAWALRQNLVVAMHRAARADLSIESAQWTRASEAFNQSGEVYTIEFSVLVPVPDHYVAISPPGPHMSTPTYEPQSTVVIDDNAADLYSSPNEDTDGELAVEIEPTPDP
jgi:hypothetical protein